jgi:vacuolar iron transporter family protein
VTFSPSAWSAKGFNCRPSGLVKLNSGDQVATQGSEILAGRYPHPQRPRLGEASPLKGARRIAGWIRPQVPEASDGILTSAGICEGFAGAGVSQDVLIFAGFAGLVAGTLAMGAVEYSKLRAQRDQQVAELAAERVRLETAPDAELDELTKLYVSRGLSPGLARQVATELTAHDALAAHAEAEYGLTPASLTSPLRDALAVSMAFAAGAVLPWLAIVLIPGPSRAVVTFLIVLAALALTGWISARISDVHPGLPMVRMASIGGLSMLITYFAGTLLHP